MAVDLVEGTCDSEKRNIQCYSSGMLNTKRKECTKVQNPRHIMREPRPPSNESICKELAQPHRRLEKCAVLLIFQIAFSTLLGTMGTIMHILLPRK